MYVEFARPDHPPPVPLDLPAQAPPRGLDCRAVILDVCERTGVRYGDIRNPDLHGRNHRVSHARMGASYMLTVVHGASLSHAGRALNCHHTTVLNAQRRVAALVLGYCAWAVASAV